MSQLGQVHKFDLPSGAVLTLSVAPFADSWALMKASLKTLRGMEMKPEDLKRDMKDLMETPSAIASVLDRIVEFATSPEVEAAVWKCAARAMYIPANSDPEFPGMKVTHSLFDDVTHGEAAREDYAKIVVGIMEVNCLPFLARVLSGFRKEKEKNPEGQLQGSR